MVHLNKEKAVSRKADLHLCLQRKGAHKNVSVLITLFPSSGYCPYGVVSFVAVKGVHTMLDHMRELQKGMIPMPGHAEEQAKIEQIFNELKTQS